MPPLSVLLKPSSSLCNMKCTYCFYHSLSKEREIYSYGQMTEALAEDIIKKAYSFSGAFPVHFAFQGGEPTLRGLSFFEFFVKATKRYDVTSQRTSFSLQTNGIALDDDWCGFLYKNRFLVGLSLDGDSLANGNRLTKDGEYTTEKVLSTAKRLKRFHVDFNILSVITNYTAENAERIYEFFKSQDFRFLQFIPCLKPLKGGSAYLDEAHLTDFYRKLFRLYYKDMQRGDYVSIRQFDNLMQLARNGKAEQCGMNGHCSLQFVMESNGNVYPCDFFCNDENLLGNISETDFFALTQAEKSRAFLTSSLSVPDKCKACRVYRLCRGGCKRYNLDMDYCKANYNFLTSILHLLR